MSETIKREYRVVDNNGLFCSDIFSSKDGAAYWISQICGDKQKYAIVERKVIYEDWTSWKEGE